MLHFNAPDVFRVPSTSHAVVVGNTAYVSGVLGTISRSIELAPGGTGPETTQAISNIEKILHETGAQLSDVAKVNVYMRRVEDFVVMDRAFAAALPHAPARTTVYGCDLPIKASVEIDVVAYLDPAT